MNRRDFFVKSAAAGAAALLIPEMAGAVRSKYSPSGVVNAPNGGAVVLFQGDSITDAGRNRSLEDRVNDFEMLGRGYPLYAAAGLLAARPDRDLRILNRGISGNRVPDLDKRWERDCIDLKPDLLSILIGVNDYGHTRGSNYDGTAERYLSEYRRLLERTRKMLPGTKIVICEPFLIHGGTVLDDSWEPAFAGYRRVAALLAAEFNAGFVPFQEVFNAALEKAPAGYWGADGIHPSTAGAVLMAEAWLKTVPSEL